MDTIVRCIVILHDMCVEARLEDDGELHDEDVEYDTAVVGSDCTPMWDGLMRLSTLESTPAPGTIAALSKVRGLMEDEAEHALTKRFLVSHIWSSHGDSE